MYKLAADSLLEYAKKKDINRAFSGVIEYLPCAGGILLDPDLLGA